MQYYVQYNKLIDLVETSSNTIDDILSKCLAYKDEIQSLLDSKGGPTRNGFLLASLCQALNCSIDDFTLYKIEDGDESSDIEVHQKLFTLPLDYDISHFR